jgi:hypothetical protein
MIRDRYRRRAERCRDRLVAQDSSTMQTEVDEELLEVVDITNAEQRGHVAFQNSFDDILAQQALTE